MRILAYGAGNIGQLYAGRLAGAGHDVSVLARGDRLEEIRKNGIRLECGTGGSRTTEHVRTVSALEPDDPYDLVLVALPSSAVTEVLPVLEASRRTPCILFFGNRAAGPEEMCEVIGRKRVLLGFPGAAATRNDGWLRYVIVPAREQPTTIGELDGRRSERIGAIRAALGSAGFPVSVCSNMDAWLKTHAAEIVPTALALYMAGLDTKRLMHTRDALVLMVRAIREGYSVLAAHGVSVTPASHRAFQVIPEPLLLRFIRSALADDTTEIKIAHAAAAHDEVKLLTAELNSLAEQPGVDTPALDRLSEHLEPGAEPIANGSARIAIARGGLWITLATLGAIAVILALLL